MLTRGASVGDLIAGAVHVIFGTGREVTAGTAESSTPTTCPGVRVSFIVSGLEMLERAVHESRRGSCSIPSTECRCRAISTGERQI